MTRIELVTPSLPRKYSTPELHRQNQSGRRDSNPRPSAWKANALSTELLPQCNKIKVQIQKSRICAIGWGKQDSNLRRRTPAELQSAPVGHFGISPITFRTCHNEPNLRFELRTPRLQITCSGQLS